MKIGSKNLLNRVYILLLMIYFTSRNSDQVKKSVLSTLKVRGILN